MSYPHRLSGPVCANRRIGLLGGSFNPAHAGHRAMSLHALKRLDLDEIWWLVSPQNPLKPHQGMEDFSRRCAGARHIAAHPKIFITPLEREFGTRFTADTLRKLKERFPRTRFVWLMGADNLRQIPRWRRWADIFTSVPVAVFHRSPYAAGRGRGKAAHRFDKGWIRISHARRLADLTPPAWTVLDNQLNAYSSTRIREDQVTWHRQKQRKPR